MDDVISTANFYQDKLGFFYHRFWGEPPCFAIDGIHEEFLSKGLRVVRPLCDQEYGCRDFDIEDCNGYRLCFGDCK